MQSPLLFQWAFSFVWNPMIQWGSVITLSVFFIENTWKKGRPVQLGPTIVDQSCKIKGSILISMIRMPQSKKITWRERLR